MAGLLSDAEKLEIRAAVKSVTDTFNVTPILYHQAQPKLDGWEEDRPKDYTNHNLLGLVEYPNTEGDETRELQGNFDYGDIMVTYNLEDFETLGLLDADKICIFTAETDYFECKGITYRVKDIKYDGPLDEKDVLIIISGDITQDNKTFT